VSDQKHFFRKSFSKTYVPTVTEDITVDLQQKVLENSMKESPETSADAILHLPSQVYKKSIMEDHIHAKEELGEADLDKAREDE
jgi:hypothetical protein